MMEQAPYVEDQDESFNDENYEGDSTTVGSGLKPNKPMTQEEITKKESQAVFFSRMVVLLVLLASTVAVVVVVYLYMTSQEQDEFDKEFDSAAVKIFESIGQTLDQTLGAADSFVNHALSYERYSSPTSWPFVTMPGFSLHISKMVKQAKAFQAHMAVVVEPDQLDQWNNYTRTNTDAIIQDAMTIQATDETYHGPKEFPINNQTFQWELWDTEHVPKTELAPEFNVMGNFFPSWQNYPVVPKSPINWDTWQMRAVRAALPEIMEQRRAAVIPVMNVLIDQSNEYIVRASTQWTMWAQLLVGDQVNASEPAGATLYPMYASDLDTAETSTDAKFVGMVIYTYFWRQFLIDILPPMTEGIIVVMSTPCDTDFTYRLDGAQATYLGPGDLHDPKYDDRGQTFSLTEIMTLENTESGSQNVYTGIPLSETHCPRYVTVYPSQDFEDEYITKNPLYFTLSAAAIFIFTSLVFILYDFLVARRQRIIKEQAMASGAIVSSLFPEKVRKQLYEEQKQEQKLQNQRNDFMTVDSSVTGAVGAVGEPKNRPMADEFHDTTIFFADLAGFTAWSAKRTPVEVFELLEALYGKFDAIAKRRCVFKIETIGDCYVAVTGIPHPQENHASILARFARDCMTEMVQVTAELSESLGEDTKDLEMRVGLHSGSTTAGVLRGEKGRFQLFGDTVNTASRMESNGVRGRIHVSQATADYLIAEGKGHWLEERPDRIVAKGKGEMVTYFVNITRGKSKSANSGDTMGQSSISGSSFRSAKPAAPLGVEQHGDRGNFTAVADC